MRWVEQKQLGAKVIEELLTGLAALAAGLLGGKIKLGTKVAKIVERVGSKAPRGVMSAAVGLAGEKLKERHRTAMAKHDYLSASLTGFRLAVDRAEQDGVLLLSHR